jgi:hypothetical protein
VVHAFNPSTWEAKAGRCEFQDSLAYRMSSRTAMATQRNSASKKKKKKKKQVFRNKHIHTYTYIHTHTHTQRQRERDTMLPGEKRLK